MNELTVSELFTRKFYGFSIIANVMSLSGGFMLFHSTIGKILLCVLVFIDILIGIEFRLKQTIIENRKIIINRYIIKVIVGMIAVLITVIDIDNPVVLYIPPMMYIVYSAFNAIISSKLISIVNPIFLTMGLIAVICKSGSSANAILYGFLTVMMIFVVTLSRKLYVAQVKETSNKVEFANSVSVIYDMVFSILRHDINNHLAGMQILAMPKYRENEELFMKTLQEHYDRIADTIRTTKMTNPECINLVDITKKSATQCGIAIAVRNDVPISVVKSNKSMLVPTIKNIVENCNEAAKRKGIKAEITLIVGKGKISVEDNCGGFDVTAIQYGRSAKSGAGHGVFLKTITSPVIKKLFGFTVTVESIPGGSRHIINFN